MILLDAPNPPSKRKKKTLQLYDSIGCVYQINIRLGIIFIVVASSAEHKSVVSFRFYLCCPFIILITTEKQISCIPLFKYVYFRPSITSNAFCHDPKSF